MYEKKGGLVFAAFFGLTALLVLSACSYEEKQGSIYIDLRSAVVYAKEGWTGAHIDPGELSDEYIWRVAPPEDFQRKRPFGAPAAPVSPDDLGFTQKEGLLIDEWTYCVPFIVDSAKWQLIKNLDAIMPGFFFSRIGDNWEIYLNGNKVDSFMHLNEEGHITRHSGYYGMVITPVFNQYFKEGENMLTIRIVGNYRSSLTGVGAQAHIDDYALIKRENGQFFPAIIIGFLLTIGIFYICVFFARKQDVYNLYFGLMALFSSLSMGMTLSSIRYLIQDSNIHMRIDNIFVMLSVAFLGCFFNQINWGKIKLPTKIYFVSGAVCIAGAIIVPWPMVESVLWAGSYLFIAYASYILLYDLIYAFVRSYIKMKSLRRVLQTTTLGKMIFPTMFEFFAYLIDGIYPIYLFGTYIRLFFIGLTVFLGAGAIMLIQNYVSVISDKEKLNAELETTVEKRTKELKEQTRIAMEQTNLAVEASKAKSEFLARMSHEIRTPLNAILGIINLVIRKKPRPEFYEDAVNIEHEGKNLLRIVNDILDFSKVESGKLELLPEEYYFSSFINDTIATIQERADEKSLEFKIKVDEHIPKKLKGDFGKLRQILINILGNAVKYTQTGSIRLEASLGKSLHLGECRLVFTVEDSGIGIKEEDKPLLFHDFTRLDVEKNRNITGTGLGLPIAASYCKAMGGSITVDSTYGKGSVFTITVEQIIVDRNPVGDILSNRYAEMLQHDTNLADAHFSAPLASVLIVDDVQTNLKVAEGMVGLFDIKTDTASSGDEAINKINKMRRHAQGQYDLVFMDHMMPGKDGIETTEALRTAGYTDIPIVALTANAIGGMREMFLEHGFNDYLAKPIEFSKLSVILEKWIPKEKQQASDVLSQEPPGLEKLLADIPGLDVKNALIRMGGMEDFYKKAVSGLMERKDESIRKLQESDENDFLMEAHSLKGLLSFIGADDLSRQASELDRHVRNGDAQWRQEHLNGFINAFSSLLDIIKKRLI